jgi:ketosteroid isomerase-like protein
MPAGDVVIGWGLWRVTVAGPDGAPVEVVGRYTDVKAERDGTWVYILDHASAPLPPPPAN